MRTHQIILRGDLMKPTTNATVMNPRKMTGGVIGCFLGFLIPFLLAQIYVRRGGDSTAAGALSFFTLLTVPLGIGIGVAAASLTPKRREALGKDDDA